MDVYREVFATMRNEYEDLMPEIGIDRDAILQILDGFASLTDGNFLHQTFTLSSNNIL